MPPKKNVDISAPATKAKEKPTRKRKLKETEVIPKLKSLPVTKMKLPSIKSFLENQTARKIKSPKPSVTAKRKIKLINEVSPVSNQSPKKAKIKSPELSAAAKRKIDLANEVALAQLKKPKLVNQLSVQEAVEEKVVTAPETQVIDRPIRKKGRPPASKTRGKNQAILPNENISAEEPVLVLQQSEVVRRTPRAKKSVSSVDEPEVKDMSKRKADSTSTPTLEPTTLTSVAKRKYIRKKVPKETEKKEETPVVKPQNKRKGKTNLTNTVSPADVDTSPSILDKPKKKLNNDMEGPRVPNAESETFDPCPTDSRKTSTSESMSWVKDISSSSTTTTCITVTSNDIVVLDKKLPVLQLSQIDSKWTNPVGNKIQSDDSDSESSSSSSSSSSNSDSESSRRSATAPSLNLSFSSPTKSNMTHEDSIKSTVTKDEDWEQALKKLSANLKKLDYEAINWIGSENCNIDTTIDIVQDKIFKLLKFENDVLKDCDCIKQHFRPDDASKDGAVIEKGLNVEKDVTNNEPVSYSSKSEDDGNFTTSQSKYVMFDQNCADEEDMLQAPAVCEDNTFSPEKPNYESYNNDDDDALSLFAESITGIESSRFNSSANSVCANASDFEEYVPQPATQIHKKTTYIPTKITDNNLTQNLKAKTVCEKQNADSTSIYKETENGSQNNASQKQIRKESPAPVQVVNRPVLLTINQKLKPMQGVKSTVFRGVCFYNLISKCMKIRCIFPHKQVENSEVRNRLSKLSETVFIQEYMLLRSWPDLRRQYGICYVNECIERKLTRVLVEMVIDFISKAKLDSVEDAGIKINVTERALMYLNDVDLDVCADLLKHDFGKGILLCDVLMQTIAETQNFSRFKAVFVKLISFIEGIGGIFQLDVASQIFERVCILPCEKPLALAVLAIIKNTDPKIFEHPMMSQFEKHLSSLDLILYGKLCRLRELAEAKKAQTSNETVHAPRLSQEVDHNNMKLMHTEREERYTSPDTTKMDNLNKQQDDATPQDIKIIRPSIFNHLFNRNPSTSPECMENKRVTKYRPWRSHQNYSNFHMGNQGNSNMGGSFPRPVRPPLMRPNLKRHSDQRNVVFGALPPKFPRRPGPDFF